MKILVISHMYLSSFDNITFFVHNQIKDFKKMGHEVKVISPVPLVPPFLKYFSRKWKNYSENPKKMIWDQIEVYYPRYLTFPKALFFSSSGKLMYLGIKKIVAEMYKGFKFDVVHSHAALPDGYAGMMIAKKYKKPLIVTIHGQDFQQTIYKNKKCKQNIKKAINFSQKTITVSEKLKNIGINKLNIDPKKIIVIPNGINVEDLYHEKSLLLKKYKRKKIILSVSNLIRTKGVDYNLRAIAELKKEYPEIVYLIAGNGPEKENLKNLTKELKIQNYVKFLGELSHNKVMEYMSICDIFSLPSWNEGFGIVYLEAMVHQKPIIAIKGQGINDIIENKKNGLLVEPKNIDSLMEALNFLLANPEKSKEIGQRAKKMVLKDYAWTKISKIIINIYQKVI